MIPFHEADVIEARVLAAMLSQGEILDTLADVETWDFDDLYCRSAFESLRNVQARGEVVSIETVAADVEDLDAVRDKHLADKVSLEWLGHLLVSTHAYEHADDALADADTLRTRRGLRERGEFVPVMKPAAEPTPEPLPPAPAVEDLAFVSMPARLVNEREQRMALAARAMSYHNAFIDDYLRALLPHDLVLLGAPTGLGKTDLALSIAMENAMSERPVAYFALEAEPLELERRLKFSWISSQAYKRNLDGKGFLNFTDWLLGRCEDIVGNLNREADEWFLSKLGGLLTFYRGAKFGQDDLRKRILEVHKRVDLMVVDHLHYVDVDEDRREAAAIGDLVKSIRDIALGIGKPILLVAHLRKKDERLKKLIPTIDDFHGSSNITKICTQAITLERASQIEAPKWWLSPTFIGIPKDRRSGACPLVALTMFDRRTRSYESHYTLGRLTKGGTEWEPLKPGEAPSWARNNRQLELEFTS